MAHNLYNDLRNFPRALKVEAFGKRSKVSNRYNASRCAQSLDTIFTQFGFYPMWEFFALRNSISTNFMQTFISLNFIDFCSVLVRVVLVSYWSTGTNVAVVAAGLS